MEIRKNGERGRMTREEAIEILKTLNMMLRNPDGEPISDVCEAIDMAINALAVLPQYKWERDIAVEQLDEYGIPFGAKKDDDVVKVVRCKYCKHKVVTEDGEYNPEDIVCEYWMSDGLDSNDYCSRGNHREDGEV